MANRWHSRGGQWHHNNGNHGNYHGNHGGHGNDNDQGWGWGNNPRGMYANQQQQNQVRPLMQEQWQRPYNNDRYYPDGDHRQWPPFSQEPYIKREPVWFK